MKNKIKITMAKLIKNKIGNIQYHGIKRILELYGNALNYDPHTNPFKSMNKNNYQVFILSSCGTYMKKIV